jgi:hypothetical protein
MQRKLTAEERQILLENPELVMFAPKGTNYLKLWIVVEVFFFIVLIIGLVFRNTVPFFNTNLFIGITMTGIFAPGPVFVLVMFLTCNPESWGRPNKRQQKTHYLRELKKSLPRGSMINIVTIEGVVPQEGAIYFYVDGKNDSWGFTTYFANPFDLDNGDKVVIAYGKNFRAFIKRAPQTEMLYESLLQEGDHNVV